MIEYSMIFITMVDMVFLRHGTTVVGSLIFLFAYCFFRARVVPASGTGTKYLVLYSSTRYFLSTVPTSCVVDCTTENSCRSTSGTSTGTRYSHQLLLEYQVPGTWYCRPYIMRTGSRLTTEKIHYYRYRTLGLRFMANKKKQKYIALLQSF